MNTLQTQLLFFITQLVFLYFFTRSTLQKIFVYLSSRIKNKKVVYVLLSFIYFPGTVVHEMSHLAMASLFLLRVKEIQVFPKITSENTLKLGHVLYEKKGAVRGILVGIAPLLLGLIFFWSLAYFRLFPSQSLALNILFSYLIFTISSTMFSSKQDLVDILYAIPLAIIGIGAIYIFNLTNISTQLLEKVNSYLFLPLVLNFCLWTLTIWFRK